MIHVNVNENVNVDENSNARLVWHGLVLELLAARPEHVAHDAVRAVLVCDLRRRREEQRGQPAQDGSHPDARDGAQTAREPPARAPTHRVHDHRASAFPSGAA